MGEGGVTRYRLVVTGFRSGAPRDPADILQAVLGMDAARAARLVRELPCVVGTTPRLEYAKTYAALLAEAGAEVHIKSEAPETQLERQTEAAAGHAARGAYVLGELDLAPAQGLERPAPASPPQAAQAAYALGELDLAPKDGPRPASPAPRAAGPLLPDKATHAAFGGLRDLSESFESLSSSQAGFEVQVDEQVLRQVQARPLHEADQRAHRGLFARLGRRLAALGEHAVRWAVGALALVVVVAITAALVSYGLDPDHVLDDVALARARQSVAAWFGWTTAQEDAPTPTRTWPREPP